MRRFVASALVLVALAVAVAAWLGHRELRSPGLAGATVEIPRGQSFEATALALERAGVVRRAWTLRGLARWRDSDRRIGAGRYRFDPGLIPIEVLERLERGDVVMVRRTLAEGLSAGEVAARLFPDDSVERERSSWSAIPPQPVWIRPRPAISRGFFFPTPTP